MKLPIFTLKIFGITCFLCNLIIIDVCLAEDPFAEDCVWKRNTCIDRCKWESVPSPSSAFILNNCVQRCKESFGDCNWGNTYRKNLLKETKQQKQDKGVQTETKLKISVDNNKTVTNTSKSKPINIVLKNGRNFLTYFYRDDGNNLSFEKYGGTITIDKNSVEEIILP